MMFEEFWQATGEPSFDALATASPACYRLSIRASRAAQHKVIRMQRPPAGTLGAPRLVAHHFAFGPDREAVAISYEIGLTEAHWHALEVLLGVADFWRMTADDRVGLDGAIYTLEGWEDGRAHTVMRWSPNVVFPGGELLAVVTDYLERLGELAMFENDTDLRERYAPRSVQ
jgi:hypothetical protein